MRHTGGGRWAGRATQRLRRARGDVMGTGLSHGSVDAHAQGPGWPISQRGQPLTMRGRMRKLALCACMKDLCDALYWEVIEAGIGRAQKHPIIGRCITTPPIHMGKANRNAVIANQWGMYTGEGLQIVNTRRISPQ